MPEPRKATDVLLDLEGKVNILLDIIRSQDLNIKLLSNKLNTIINGMGSSSSPKFTAETTQSLPPAAFKMPEADPNKNIFIEAESAIPQTNQPDGFRRTSRPETFVKQPANKPSNEEVKLSGRPAEVVVQPREAAKPVEMPQTKPSEDEQSSGQGHIPVSQRCVDKNGKSMFLASVEITDLSTNQLVCKVKTNGTGKYLTSLGVGNYRVLIRKGESLTKDKLEASQDIKVDASMSKLDLPVIIIK